MGIFQNSAIRDKSSGILFAEDFDDETGSQALASSSPIDPHEPEIIEAHFSAADLAQARHEGVAEGAASAEAKWTERETHSASIICEKITALFEQARRDAIIVQEQACEAAAKLIFSMLAAVLPSLCERHAAAEIVSVVQDVLFGMTPESCVNLHVSQDAAEAVRVTLGDLAPELLRRVMIIPRQETALADMILTWDGGGATLTSRRAQSAVASILASLGLLEDPGMEPLQMRPSQQPKPRSLGDDPPPPHIPYKFEKMESLDG